MNFAIRQIPKLRRFAYSNWTTMAQERKPEVLVESKRALRASIKSLLRNLPSQELDEQSSKISMNVMESELFKKARNVGLYIHCPKLNEVNTSWIVAEALNEGKQCFVPRVVNRNAHMELLHIESDRDLCEVPPFGILEPPDCYQNSNQRRMNALDAGLDLLLVPGMGFDNQGGRLGRGGGYYDAFISQCLKSSKSQGKPPPVLVGLAFDCQVVSNGVPYGPSDQHLDYLATHKSLESCQPRDPVD